ALSVLRAAAGHHPLDLLDRGSDLLPERGHALERPLDGFLRAASPQGRESPLEDLLALFQDPFTLLRHALLRVGGAASGRRGGPPSGESAPRIAVTRSASSAIFSSPESTFLPARMPALSPRSTFSSPESMRCPASSACLRNFWIDARPLSMRPAVPGFAAGAWTGSLPAAGPRFCRAPSVRFSWVPPPPPR